MYLVSTLLTVPIMVWTAYSSSAGEWYAHRTLIGIICAPIEALPEISIPDLFFAHERGSYMSLYVFVLFGSNFIAPLIAGWFNDAYGWRWTMFFGAFISAGTFIILLFGMEETMYFRTGMEGIEPERVHVQDPVLMDTKSEEKSGSVTPAKSKASPTRGQYPAPRTYVQKLKPFVSWPGRPSNKQMLWMMIRPLLIIVRFPNIAWAGFVYVSSKGRLIKLLTHLSKDCKGEALGCAVVHRNPPRRHQQALALACLSGGVFS